MTESKSKSKTRVVNKTKEKFDVYIGRGGPFGNPFVMKSKSAKERTLVIEKFREYFLDKVREDAKFAALVKKECSGKRLGCFCKPLACHGDVIVEWIEHAGESIAFEEFK